MSNTYIASVYANRIIKGEITINNVPAELKSLVSKLVEEKRKTRQ